MSSQQVWLSSPNPPPWQCSHARLCSDTHKVSGTFAGLLSILFSITRHHCSRCYVLLAFLSAFIHLPDHWGRGEGRRELQRRGAQLAHWSFFAFRHRDLNLGSCTCLEALDYCAMQHLPLGLASSVKSFNRVKSPHFAYMGRGNSNVLVYSHWQKTQRGK